MHGRRFDRFLTGTAHRAGLEPRPSRRRAARRASRASRRSRPRSRCPSRPTCRRRPPPTSRPGTRDHRLDRRSTCPIRPIFRRRPSRMSRRRAPAAPAPAAPPRCGTGRRAAPPPAAPAPAPVVAANRRPADHGRAARAHRQPSSPASSTARPTAPRSRRSTPRATTRRSGSATAARPSAPSRRSTHLRHADADGLDPADYPVPSIQAGADARRAGRSRDAADRVRARLCAPRPDRPRALFARQRRHHLRADAPGAARRAEQARGEQATPPRRSTAISRRTPPTRRCARSSPKRAATRATPARRRSRAARCSSLRPTSAPSRPC